VKLRLSEEGLKTREVKDCIQDIYDAMEAQKNLSTAGHLKSLPKIVKPSLQSLGLWRSLAKQQRMSHLKYVKNTLPFRGKIWQGYGTN
jgi:hypothetical protein